MKLIDDENPKANLLYYIKMGRVYFNLIAGLEINRGNALKVFEIALSKARHFELFCTLPLVLLPPTSRHGEAAK
jgi:hypothetical protein